jgi:hypothetical protein
MYNDHATTGDQYAARGYAILSGFFSPAFMKGVQRECDRLVASEHVHPDNIRSPFQKTSGATPERIDPVADISPLFARLVRHPRLAQAVEACIGGASVLFKDKLILKPPGMDGYALHQDHAWWTRFVPADKPMVSAMLAVDDAGAKSGALQVFPRMDRLAAVDRYMNKEESRESRAAAPGETLALKAGDVVLFSSLTPHCSGPNLSDSYRRALFLTYNTVDQGSLRDRYYKYYIERETKGGAQLKFW